MLSQHAEPPFKEAFSLQDVLLMSVAAMGTLIAEEMRHINKKCLHWAAFMTLIPEYTQIFGRNHAHTANFEYSVWVWSQCPSKVTRL